MNLDDLPANELARIDAVCLQYESDLRSGASPSIDSIVDRHGGSSAAILRRELEIVRDELTSQRPSNVTSQPFSIASPPPMTSSESALPGTGTGTVIGPYMIEGILGRGGMGVVYKATDQRLERTVAIKMLDARIATRDDLSERFQREARAVAGLSHPNIVELFDVGSFNGLPYAVMEHLDGESLDARFERSPLSIEEVRRLGSQIADALETAHAAGVVHRDLKPDNVMLVRRRVSSPSDSGIGTTPGGLPDGKNDSKSTIVKLFDFGLSRVPPSAVANDAHQTHEGTVMGTPGYMAPEQARGEGVTPAADIFSLGCVLYEAFYRRPAFDGDTKAARITASLNAAADIDPIRRRDDPDLADLIDECLQKAIADRPASAESIAHRLRSVTDSDVALASRRGVQPSPRRPLGFGSIVAVALAGVVMTLLAFATMSDWMSSKNVVRLDQIRSLAVLTFIDKSHPEWIATDTKSSDPLQPIGDKPMHQGEQLSALLVHELSRMAKVRVPRFRPMDADTPDQLRQLGKQWDVDALLSGTIETVTIGEDPFVELDLALISSATGNQIWGRKIHLQAGENFLEQSRLATEVATVVGQTLTATAAETAPPTIESFRCLIDGETRSDPDSVSGLAMALKCFKKAHEADPRFADPLAGIALTSITLAGQSSIDDTAGLVIAARTAAEDAIRRDPGSVDARLAMAMLDWQTLTRYDQAERVLHELTMVDSNHWQVQHQYGLLLLTMGRFDAAAVALREASLLNPMSLIVKVDRARAAWFAGDASRAIADAKTLIDRYGDNPMVSGLLVDIYETQSLYDAAAALQRDFPKQASWTREDYFAEREKHLASSPYGPLGEQCNRAIWQSRRESIIDDITLARWLDPMPPMMPMILARHPALSEVRKLDRAAEVLPQDEDL
ncbi:Serine/threonine-protein kinase Pkn1 [Rubripirellula tenax]|uniref:Serine/threonine-protein kinase Pkn1 n=1 Tax=Rubripirellula tenax TaxID=2528015 RepID=A0A5C6F8J6_9BACT|nr:serine/threonine-protein kinase [Rubripirellula tenax]TWU56687.1 Serine/threonine-protein kinase Pkn1 [Rubripirellula tenax]